MLFEQHRIPFVWVAGENHDDFEKQLRNHAMVTNIRTLTRIGESVLYRIEWYEDE